jgi:hypothetical protein
MRKRAINFAGTADKIDEFLSLDTMLQVVFFYASWYAWTRYGKTLLITSVLRDDGVHADGRGLDVDVCDGFVYQGGLLPGEAQEIVDIINLGFVYDPHRMDMRVAIYGENDPKGKHWDHIHFQTCWGDRSRCL